MSTFDNTKTLKLIELIKQTLETDVVDDLRTTVSQIKGGKTPSTLGGKGNLISTNSSWKMNPSTLRDLAGTYVLGTLLFKKYLRQEEEYEYSITIPAYKFMQTSKSIVLNDKWTLDYTIESLELVLRSESLKLQYSFEYRWKLINTSYKILVFDETFQTLKLFEEIPKYILEMSDLKRIDIQSPKNRKIFTLSKSTHVFTIQNPPNIPEVVPLVNGRIENLNYFEHNNAIIRLVSIQRLPSIQSLLLTQSRPQNVTLLSTFRLIINPILKGPELNIAQSHMMNISVPETPLVPYKTITVKKKVDVERNGEIITQEELEIQRYNVWLEGKTKINPLAEHVREKLNGVCFLSQGNTNPIDQIAESLNGTIKFESFSKIRIRTLPITKGVISGKPPLPELKINNLDDAFPSSGQFNLFRFDCNLTLKTLDQNILIFGKNIMDCVPLIAGFVQTDIDLFDIIQQYDLRTNAIEMSFKKLWDGWQEVLNRWITFKTKEGVQIDEIFYFLEQEIWNIIVSAFAKAQRLIPEHIISKYFYFQEKVYIFEGKRLKNISPPEFLSDGTYVYEWTRTSETPSRKEDPRISWPIPNELTQTDYQYFYYIHPKSEDWIVWEVDTKELVHSLRKNLSKFEKTEFTHLTLMIWTNSGYEHVPYSKIINWDMNYDTIELDHSLNIKLPCLMWIINRRPISPFEPKYLQWTIIQGFKIVKK